MKGPFKGSLRGEVEILNSPGEGGFSCACDRRSPGSIEARKGPK